MLRVDCEGAHCAGGRVRYARGTTQNLKVMHQAGMQIRLPVSMAV